MSFNLSRTILLKAVWCCSVMGSKSLVNKKYHVILFSLECSLIIMLIIFPPVTWKILIPFKTQHSYPYLNRTRISGGQD